MWGAGCWVTGCLLILEATAADVLYRSGRRICSSSGQTGLVPVTQSYAQPVHKPLITMCEGQRVCSTYRTTYKISYRQVSKKTSLPLYTCCPGWGRTDANSCNKDVNECESGRLRCSQRCINTSGRFRCDCYEGFRLSDDGKSCHKVERTSAVSPTPSSVNRTGETETMRQEMQELRSKIAALEQKLQLVWAPFQSLTPAAPEDHLSPVTFLTHSFQQLDRIDSLSEQISFLEERLETCKCGPCDLCT
ncbi:hypothetical protein GDO78_015450 [Eleutherodactylus coqui]|uniref:EMI domain-containing protein n=1 Tax=Eleutherodactylus coqui TaxID=57060 RepID=A0A8J6EDL6_ELECQ|nr:hypothetical protein GDO78_015450 [Eleutherodactylus coqui]